MNIHVNVHSCSNFTGFSKLTFIELYPIFWQNTLKRWLWITNLLIESYLDFGMTNFSVVKGSSPRSCLVLQSTDPAMMSHRQSTSLKYPRKIGVAAESANIIGQSGASWTQFQLPIFIATDHKKAWPFYNKQAKIFSTVKWLHFRNSYNKVDCHLVVESFSLRQVTSLEKV